MPMSMPIMHACTRVCWRRQIFTCTHTQRGSWDVRRTQSEQNDPDTPLLLNLNRRRRCRAPPSPEARHWQCEGQQAAHPHSTLLARAFVGRCRTHCAQGAAQSAWCARTGKGRRGQPHLAPLRLSAWRGPAAAERCLLGRATHATHRRLFPLFLNCRRRLQRGQRKSRQSLPQLRPRCVSSLLRQRHLHRRARPRAARSSATTTTIVAIAAPPARSACKRSSYGPCGTSTPKRPSAASHFVLAWQKAARACHARASVYAVGGRSPQERT